MGLTVVKKQRANFDLAARMKELGKIGVLVGIPSDRTARDGESVTSSELLYLHTHGIRRKAMRQEMDKDVERGMKYSEAHELYLQSHGSPLWASPPRPVLEPAIAANKAVIARTMNAGVKQYLQTKNDRGLRSAGNLAASYAKKWFTDPRNGWAPNSPRTIMRKGSSRPLIDTGAMQEAITYVVRKD